MTRTCTGLLALLLFTAAPAVAQTVMTFSPQPPPPGQPANNAAAPPPGTATLRGHVFAADSGQPLRKAQVRATATDIRETRLATTDAEGRYELTEVRPGRYTISASKGSYVGLSYGQQRLTDAGKPLQILDNQTVERVDFSLPRGGIVTGRIVDEFGEPLSDVQVAAQRYQFVQGQRRLVPSGRTASTNDIGEFRLFGVPPGQYYLNATWRNQNPNQINQNDRTAYAPLYFPGTVNPGEARRITLTAGQQLDDLVMAMVPIKATKVTGTATSSTGTPLVGMLLVTQSNVGGFGLSMMTSAQIRPDGTFTINGLAPGEYVLRAQSFGNSGPDVEAAVLKITATGDDITDVHLAGARQSTATGRLIVDPAAAPSLATLSIAAMALDPGSMPMGMTPSRVNDDYTFELKATPGRMRLMLMNQPLGWAIRAVRLNGVDVTDAGIDFKPNEDVSGIEIEMTNKLTTIAGLVTNARGEAVKDYSAIVFSQDRANWTGNSRYQGSGRPDQDGRFKVSGLPPGDYYIVAIDQIDPGQAGDPDFLESVRGKATSFTVSEGETKTLDLRIVTAS